MIVRAFLRFHLFRLFFDESRFHASSCPTEARSRSKPRDGVHPSSLVSTELDLLYAFFTRERLSSQSSLTHRVEPLYSLRSWALLKLYESRLVERERRGVNQSSEGSIELFASDRRVTVDNATKY